MATNDPRALLARLLREPSETEWLEFKRNNADPEEIGRCVSACANASMLARRDRAFLVWGIEDGSRQRVGTTVRLRALKRGGESFANWLIRLLEPRLWLEFLDFEDEGKQFSIQTIDPAYDRPVRFSGAEYIRIGDSIRPLREFPEYERSLWLATGSRRFESGIAFRHQTATDVLNTLDVSAYYTLARSPQPQNTEEILARFAKLGLIREDWEGGFDITNLGAILFAREITGFPSIAPKSVRVIKYSGVDKRDSEDEIESRKGYAVGFSELQRYLLRQLPREERYIDGVRHAVSKYSEIAIREILANALIHQDFTISGAGPVIEVYADRLEISNAGNSLIEKDRIIDERRSRNEQLCRLMRDLGMCEERGGGIDKAIIDIEERSLPAPEFVTSKDSMRVVIFGPKKFNELTKAERVWCCFCHCVIRWMQNEYMNNTSLRARFRLPNEQYQAVLAVISDAKKEGRIVPADPQQAKKTARYVPYWAGP
jgi:ATP-dependent DNA helicase RecG